MPHAFNPKTFEQLVGKQPKLEVMLSMVSEALNWPYLKARYHYFDKRSKTLSLAYLAQVRANQSRVRCNLNNIKHAGVKHGNSKASD